MEEGFTLKELMEVYTISELRVSKIAAKDLLKIGVKVNELVGFCEGARGARELRIAGTTWSRTHPPHPPCLTNRPH